MLTHPQARMSAAEYLAFERASETKHEFFGGEVFAMAGASPAHVLICSNLIRTLGNQLAARDCSAYGSDLRVNVSPTGLYTYPDVTVVCGKLLLAEDNLLNPRVIVEVLSPSTEAYDRGKKFEHYRTIESLIDYVLVAQDAAHVEIFTRRPDGRWLFSEASGLAATVALESIDCAMALADVYAKVDLPDESAAQTRPGNAG